jgi:hypothetical protein
MAAAVALPAPAAWLGDFDEEVVDVPNAEGLAAGYYASEAVAEQQEDVPLLSSEPGPGLAGDDDAAGPSSAATAEQSEEWSEEPGAIYAASETGASAAMASAAAAVAATEQPAAAAAPAAAATSGGTSQPGQDALGPRSKTPSAEVLEIPNRTGTPLKMSRAAGRVAGAPATASGTAADGSGTSPVFFADDGDDDPDADDDGWGDTVMPGVVSVEEAMATTPAKAAPEMDWEALAALVCPPARPPARPPFPADLPRIVRTTGGQSSGGS